MKKIIILCMCLISLLLTAFIGENCLREELKVFEYEKVVAITFDDGPDSRYTKELLDGLSKRGVVASFFLIGEKIEGNEEIVLRMKSEGHLIGNHSYTHIEFNNCKSSKCHEEICKTSEAIEAVTGEKVRYIRPPYGFGEEELFLDEGLQPIYWSVDTLDWKLLNSKAIINNTLNNIKSGDIILMHDIYPTSIVAALNLIDNLKQRGYKFVTVDELLIE